ncbi:MAG: alpha-D-ribose 1-methylphosphonate 5-triphosphate diphosphatase [Pseudomonadota bacterium]
MKTVLANAKLVLETEVVEGAITIEDGVIAAIDQGAGPVAGAEDMEGDYLAPGLVELHTDNLERHMQPRPGVKWPLAAAVIAHDRELASVGVTTVFDALRVGSILSEKKAKYGKYARPVADEILAQRAAGHLKISHFLHLRAEICSETLVEELEEFGPEDRIGILSMMDHTPGQRQFRDTAKMAEYLIGKYGMSEEGIAEYFGRLKALSDRVREPHEAAAAAAGGRLGAVLASHDDTTESDVATSKAYGCRIGEFPTTAEAAKASHGAGIAVIMGAPNYLRGGSHSGNIAASELAHAGHLDILSSDYAPSSLLMGAVRMGLEFDDLPRGLRTVTKAPAEAAALQDRGAIEIGKRADLAQFEIAGDLPAVKATWSQGRRV